MTFRSLALSNIRGNWRSYSAFFLSSVFSVLIFYLYAAFLFHPDVLSGHVMAAGKVRQGMNFCEYVIIIFSFLFVLYANSAFLKTRKQEFGLFTLFGMTRMQLRRLVAYENIAIGVLSVAVGIGLGMLFSKLFFMALGVLLGAADPIPFAVPVKAVLLTVTGFIALFIAIALLTAVRIGRTEIIDLLKDRSKPKGELKFSPWLVALALVCLAAAYGMALLMNGNTFILLALPILFTVIVGTYFLFTQFSTMLLMFLHRRHGIFYSRTKMMIISQLGYKIKDNARILFMVSILSAVILTASGTFYLLQLTQKQELLQASPYSIGFVEKGLHAHEVLDPDTVRSIVRRDGFRITKDVQATGITAASPSFREKKGGRTNDYEHYGAMIVSQSEYNKLASEAGKNKVSVGRGEAFLSASGWIVRANEAGQVSVTVNGERKTFSYTRTADEAVINRAYASDIMIVLDDHAYADLLAHTPEENLMAAYAMELSDWEKSADTIAKIKDLVPEALTDQADLNRAESWARVSETISLTLFIGMFISLLFFIASGSMLYFKLFTEMQEDRAQFSALRRIGITKGEIRRIVVSQIAIIFYIPLVVGTIHALFAMKALDNMMPSSNWIYSFVVVGIYAVMQTIYFIVASVSYMRNMTRGATAS